MQNYKYTVGHSVRRYYFDSCRKLLCISPKGSVAKNNGKEPVICRRGSPILKAAVHGYTEHRKHYVPSVYMKDMLQMEMTK